MRKSQFIFVLMLSTSFATMARADDTSLANCLKAGEVNCVKIRGSDTYYALSGDEGNQTMTIYGTNAEGTVATVPEYAFLSDETWKSKFPRGVTSLKTSGNVDIGESAFGLATNLTSIDLTGVRTIGHYAFEGATNLTSANLTGVQTIKNGAFLNATSLTSVDLTGVQSIGADAFDSTRLTSVDLTGVKTIGYCAFCANGDLTSIVISDSLLDDDGNILGYDKRDGVYTGIDAGAFDEFELNTIYCPAGKTCGNFFTGWSKTPKVIPYSIENGQIKAGGKTYASLNDLASGNHIVKRIYTIDEANAVAGEKNRVSIKYR